MPNRAVVCVATTEHYQRGMARLAGAIERQENADFLGWPMERERDTMNGWPAHADVPYAFKAFALMEASKRAYDTLLWCDACMFPVQDMQPLWERIERDGYWFSKNGWSNYEWTADSAYPDLFRVPVLEQHFEQPDLDTLRAMNKNIPHVVATCFGISLKSREGAEFLREYFRLASETKTFCGPWINASHPDWLSQPGAQERSMGNGRVAPCGPSDVRGHRHDQTAASVLAYRLGMKLTDPPEIFSYGKQGDAFDPRTILIADGSYA